MTEALLLNIKGTPHEVDSIVDCQRGLQKDAVRLKLEMCCGCHAGRALWFPLDSVMRDGNQALTQLTLQSVYLLRKGLEISE